MSRLERRDREPPVGALAELGFVNVPNVGYVMRAAPASECGITASISARLSALGNAARPTLGMLARLAGTGAAMIGVAQADNEGEAWFQVVMAQACAAQPEACVGVGAVGVLGWLGVENAKLKQGLIEHATADGDVTWVRLSC